MQRKAFSKEIQEVRDEVLLLSSMVEQAVMASVEVLKNHDLEHAWAVRRNDLEINRKRFEIKLLIMVLIATQPSVTIIVRHLLPII